MKFIYTLLGTALVCISVVLPEYWYLVIPGLGFFLYDLWFHTNSRNTAFLKGFFFGICTSSASLSWWWDALPFEWIQIDHTTGMLVIFIAWSIVSATLGLGNALAAPVFWMSRRSIFLPVIVAILWPATELLRMWLFALLTFGPESLLAPHFAITSLAYNLAEQPYLLQFAAYGGIYALSAVLGFCACLFALLYAYILRSKSTSHVHALALGIFILLVAAPIPFIFPHKETAEREPFVIAILPTTKLHDYATTLSIPSALARLEKESRPDLIVFPEDERLADYFSDKNAIAAIFKTTNPTIMSTAYANEHNEVYVQLVYSSPKEGVLGTYNKQFLMPESEQNPYLSTPAYALVEDDAVKTYFGERKFVSKGTELYAQKIKDRVIGGLVCSDMLSPILYRDLVRKHGANILVNVSNPTWFNDSKLLYDRTLQQARVHAVEHRMPFVFANKEAPSFVIGPDGKTIAESAWGDTTPLTITLY